MRNDLDRRYSFCATPLRCTFIDTGVAPVCEDLVRSEKLNQSEPHYPSHSFICEKNLLVQPEVFVHPPETYKDYARFSSYHTLPLPLTSLCICFARSENYKNLTAFHFFLK